MTSPSTRRPADPAAAPRRVAGGDAGALAALRPPEPRHPPGTGRRPPEGPQRAGDPGTTSGVARAFHTFNGHVLFASTLSCASASSSCCVSPPSGTPSTSGGSMSSSPAMPASTPTRSPRSPKGPGAPGWSPFGGRCSARSTSCSATPRSPMPRGRRWPRARRAAAPGPGLHRRRLRPAGDGPPAFRVELDDDLLRE